MFFGRCTAPRVLFTGARALRSFFEFELQPGSKVRDIELEIDTALKNTRVARVFQIRSSISGGTRGMPLSVPSALARKEL